MSDATAPDSVEQPSETGSGEYRVLARRYRPDSFESLIGQEPMVQTLGNAFATGRIAQAYMLTGVRGVGKTTTARILARALNYETETVDKPTLDLSTPGIHCQSIMEGNHIDVIEMDAASHTGIGDIREIIAAVRYKPVSARYKVYIIDEVHMLSTAAFNGLLKTLEEPPEHVKFIFATTEIRKVPITVLSRCQRFDLRRIESGELAQHLQMIVGKEGVEAEDEALAMIARAGEGSARDALSLLDQAIAHADGAGGGKVLAGNVRDLLGLADRSRVIDLFEFIMKGDIAAALHELKDQFDTGADPAVVLTDLADFVHFVTRVRYVETALDDPSLSQDEKERGKAFAVALNPRILGRTWQMLLKGIAEVQSSPRPMAAADMVLVRLTHAADLPSPEEALKQLADQGGSPAGRSPASTQNGAQNGSSAGGSSQGSAMPAASAISDRSDGGATMRQGNGPSLQATAEPQTQDAPVKAYETINTFEHLLGVAEAKRDIKFKMLLRNNVSLVHFEPGRIELKPVGNPPRDLMNQMSSRLKEWTGENWMIVLSEADGDVTVRQREEAEHEALVADAEQDPVVAAVLAKFPKSRIVDIRFPKADTAIDEDDAAAAALDNPDNDFGPDDEKGPGSIPAAQSLDDYFDT